MKFVPSCESGYYVSDNGKFYAEFQKYPRGYHFKTIATTRNPNQFYIGFYKTLKSGAEVCKNFDIDWE